MGAWNTSALKGVGQNRHALPPLQVVRLVRERAAYAERVPESPKEK
jgi:hypothetical protein